MKRFSGWRHAFGLVLLAAAPAHGQSGLKAPDAASEGWPGDPRECSSIDDDRDRLACFDQATGRQPRAAPPLANPPPARSPPDLSSPSPPAEVRLPPPTLEDLLPVGDNPFAQAAVNVRRSLGTTLSDRWELEPATERGRFLLRPYKPMYALIVDWSSRKNELPQSPNPANSVAEPLSLRRAEAKFQLSLKTKVWKDMLGSSGDLWLGYTQTSYWQIYNSGESRPFRESNYEPEIMTVFPTDYSVFGWRGRMAGLSLNHQSNGRSLPLSRSWNRVVAQFGFERRNLMLMVRPWWRIPESGRTDDNPDVEDFLGRGDLLLVRKSEGHELSVMLRHSLRSGSRSRGAVQLDYAFPITSYLKAYAQVFSGYGASLIDYNHHQTRIGLGISLVQWL